MQFFVNQQRHVLPEIKSVEAYVALSKSDKIEVRDGLWKHPDLIDAYMAENPHGLSVREAELVGKRKRFVAGTFQVFRFSKKHSTFIGEGSLPNDVLGVYDGLEDVFYGRRRPS